MTVNVQSKTNMYTFVKINVTIFNTQNLPIKVGSNAAASTAAAAVKTRRSMASIHFRQQHKRKIYWKYTENFLSPPIAGNVLVLKIVTLILTNVYMLVFEHVQLSLSLFTWWCLQVNCKCNWSDSHGDGGSAQYGQVYHELASFFLHSCDDVLTPLVLVSNYTVAHTSLLPSSLSLSPSGDLCKQPQWATNPVTSLLACSQLIWTALFHITSTEISG